MAIKNNLTFPVSPVTGQETVTFLNDAFETVLRSSFGDTPPDDQTHQYWLDTSNNRYRVMRFCVDTSSSIYENWVEMWRYDTQDKVFLTSDFFKTKWAGSILDHFNGNPSILNKVGTAANAVATREKNDIKFIEDVNTSLGLSALNNNGILVSLKNLLNSSDVNGISLFFDGLKAYLSKDFVSTTAGVNNSLGDFKQIAMIEDINDMGSGSGFEERNIFSGLATHNVDVSDGTYYVIEVVGSGSGGGGGAATAHTISSFGMDGLLINVGKGSDGGLGGVTGFSFTKEIDGANRLISMFEQPSPIGKGGVNSNLNTSTTYTGGGGGSSVIQEETYGDLTAFGNASYARTLITFLGFKKLGELSGSVVSGGSTDPTSKSVTKNIFSAVGDGIGSSKDITIAYSGGEGNKREYMSRWLVDLSGVNTLTLSVGAGGSGGGGSPFNFGGSADVDLRVYGNHVLGGNGSDGIITLYKIN